MNSIEIVQLLVPLGALIWILIYVRYYTGALECSVHKESQQDGGSIAVECEISPRLSGLSGGMQPHGIDILGTTNKLTDSVVSKLLPQEEARLGEGLKGMFKVDQKLVTPVISGADVK